MCADSIPYEIPGSFYLGRGTADAAPLLLRSKDLCTHGVILGQTGSGKTGLGVALLEEAAIDGIPAIVIDPKGDLSNLLLHFPKLNGEDFEPWVDPAEADRKGLDIDEFATKTAKTWDKGIQSWGQGKQRIERLQQAADYCVYTPGSTAGVPVSLLSCLSAPDEETRTDSERLGEKVASTASALLALIGDQADPLTDPRHIFLSNLLQHLWGSGAKPGLEEFIRAVQNPPFTKVGLLPLEDFFSASDRSKLAIAFNNLLAAPGFATWLQGEAIDLDKMLTGPSGKPQVSVFSIAHLSDEERMFFVSMLLDQLISWMRRQSGTSSLRALLYMDEVFGFLPPTANPPSKVPMLTLLKQARAFGVGLVLSTQNPVDLDYKALSNMGTWMIGKLQTERDVDRVIDGLRSAGAGLDVKELRARLAGLPKRQFLLHRSNGDDLFFDVRWVLNFLAGPLTKNQIRKLMEPIRARFEGRSPVVVRSALAENSGSGSTSRPILPNGVEEAFAPITESGKTWEYRPWLLQEGRYSVDRDKYSVDVEKKIARVIPLLAEEKSPLWEEFEELPCEVKALEEKPENDSSFIELPGWVTGDAIKDWKKEFQDEIYRKEEVVVWHSELTEETSSPGETKEAFLGSIRQQINEERDQALEKALASMKRRLETQEDQVRRARQRVEREKEQRKGRWWQNIIRIAGLVLGGLITSGSRVTATRTRSAGTVLRSLVGGDNDLKRAEENLEAEMEDVTNLQAEMEAKRESLEERFARTADDLEEIRISPYKKDIRVEQPRIVWIATANNN